MAPDGAGYAFLPCFTSVVIQIIQQLDILPDKSKNYAPVAVDRDRPKILAYASFLPGTCYCKRRPFTKYLPTAPDPNPTPAEITNAPYKDFVRYPARTTTNNEASAADISTVSLSGYPKRACPNKNETDATNPNEPNIDVKICADKFAPQLGSEIPKRNTETSAYTKDRESHAMK